MWGAYSPRLSLSSANFADNPQQMGRVQLIGAIVAAALSLPSVAWACLCGSSSETRTVAQRTDEVRRELEKAVAVFSGEVMGLNALVVRFKVETVWKGQLPPEFAMSNGAQLSADGSMASSSCDFNFLVGKTYLVFAYGKSTQDMSATSCTLTGSMPFASDRIMFLDMVAFGQRPAGSNSPRTITVLGNVVKQGLVEWTEGMTVRDAIDQAGGYRPLPILVREPGIRAALANSTITRRYPEWARRSGVVMPSTVLLENDNLWIGQDIK